MDIPQGGSSCPKTQIFNKHFKNQGQRGNQFSGYRQSAAKELNSSNREQNPLSCSVEDINPEPSALTTRPRSEEERS